MNDPSLHKEEKDKFNVKSVEMLVDSAVDVKANANIIVPGYKTIKIEIENTNNKSFV